MKSNQSFDKFLHQCGSLLYYMTCAATPKYMCNMRSVCVERSGKSTHIESGCVEYPYTHLYTLQNVAFVVIGTDR